MTDNVSSLSTANSMRLAVTRIQRELDDVRNEASSGKVADRGLTLGVRTTVAVDLEQQVKRIDTIKTLNATVAARIDSTDSVLSSIGSIVDSALKQITQAKTAGAQIDVAISVARGALQSINDRLNTSFNGQYLFAGVNTDVKPVADNPDDPAAPGRIAVDGAFLAKFGFNQANAGVGGIAAATMGSFLDNEWANLFDDTGWRTNFSSASQKPIQSRVTISEYTDSSVTADAQAFRDITSALAMISQTGLDKMSGATRAVVVDKALQKLGAGKQELTQVQSDLGDAKARVDDATQRLTIQSQSLSKTIGSMEDADPYEVSVRLNALSSQLETAYSLTSRMQNMSLLKFL